MIQRVAKSIGHITVCIINKTVNVTNNSSFHSYNTKLKIATTRSIYRLTYSNFVFNSPKPEIATSHSIYRLLTHVISSVKTLGLVYKVVHR